jgi:amino acid transporter
VKDLSILTIGAIVGAGILVLAGAVSLAGDNGTLAVFVLGGALMATLIVLAVRAGRSNPPGP